jgi:uncharacterized protein YkwD
MPITLHVRRALVAVGALAAVVLPAAPASALVQRIVGHQVSVPCVAGVTSSCDATPGPRVCDNADVLPNAANVAAAQQATLCLVNNERVSRGRPRLHANDTLRGVAQAYTLEMVAHSFFSHVSPTGSTFDQRIRHAGYLSGTRGWTIGENLAWGGGILSTPREIVSAWMHSPEHRRNILDRRFRDAGIGIAIGLPGPGAGATYANEFGRRIS